MRIYATKIIDATIQEKETSKHKVKKTKDDFEIVPAHEVKQLIECRCEICGSSAERFHWEEGLEGNSSLLALMIETYHFSNGSEDRTEDFFGDYWYEVCEPCMRSKIIPYLLSLRRQSSSPSLAQTSCFTEPESPPMRDQRLIGMDDEEDVHDVVHDEGEMRDGDPF